MGVRMIPFFKSKKGWQMAGQGLDSSGGGGGTHLPDFSTEEFDTGRKWTDGKEIYGKVVVLNSSTQSYTLSTGQTLVDWNALINVSAGADSYKVKNYADGDGYIASVNFDSGLNRISVNIAKWTYGGATITVYYTKSN